MQTIDKTWEIYRNEKDLQAKDKAKEELILHYSHIIKYVAGRLGIHVGSLVDTDDLISYGIFGLIDAIEKFELGKGVKFETYASLRIRGSIIDGLRALDWVPRALRQKHKRVETAYSELVAELGQEPTNEQMAEKMGISVEQVEDEIKKSSLLSLISLNEYLEQNHEGDFADAAAGSHDLPELNYEQKELKETLIDALEHLTEKEKLVVTLYYFEELTLKEISKIMNVTESRISQIHSKSLLKLRTRLGKYRGILLE